MTHDEIDKLEAGRELDALIAVEVMGFSYSERTVGPGGFFAEGTLLQDWSDPGGDLVATRFNGEITNIQKGGIPFYGTDIAAAWKILDKMIDLGFSYEVSHQTKDKSIKYVMFALGEYNVRESTFDQEFIGYANTTPLAICRSALKAVMVKA